MKLNLLLLLIIPLAVVCLFSCDSTDPFLKYEGVNFLDGLNFDSPRWQREYRPEDPQPLYPDYMIWEEVSGETPPAAGHPVYRLEIQNLFPDGMFEDTASLTFWDTAGILATSTFTVDGAAERLEFNLQLSDIVYYNLFDPTTGLFHLRTGGEVLTNDDKINYLLRFDAFEDPAPNGTYIWMDLTNLANSLLGAREQLLVEKSSGGTEIINTFMVSEPENFNFLSFGMEEDAQKASMGGYIDNFRILRTDLVYRLCIELPYHSAARWETDLVSGTYTFTVAVKNDPRTGSANHFPGRFVTMEIQSRAIPDQQSATPYYAPSGWTEWTDISVSGFFQIDKTAETSLNVLELCIYPTISGSEDGSIQGLAGTDAGALLFANPRLTFSQN